MPDPFKHVRPGEEVTFSATAHNATLDAARAHRERSRTGQAGASEPGRDAAIVRLKNASGGDLLRGSIVGIDGPVFDPDGDLEAFLREVAISGVTPTADHTDRFAILIEPIPDGRVGRAAVAGVALVQVDVTDDAHEFAEAEAANSSELVSADTGPAQILWRQGDDDAGYSTGVQWAIVLFGTSCGSGSYY